MLGVFDVVECVVVLFNVVGIVIVMIEYGFDYGVWVLMLLMFLEVDVLVV